LSPADFQTIPPRIHPAGILEDAEADPEGLIGGEELGSPEEGSGMDWALPRKK